MGENTVGSLGWAKLEINIDDRESGFLIAVLSTLD